MIDDKKLADYIKSNPALLNFLDRLDIKLGIRDKSIREICGEYNLDLKFVTDLMMLIINREEFNSDNTENYNISNTVNYLRNSHRSYINEYIPELKNLINQLSDTEPARFADCNLLMMYFRDYQDEFLKHLNYEDTVIFPYIIKISSDKSPGKTDELVELVKQKSITGYMQHHDNLDEKLEDLKNLLIKYFKPFDNSKIVRRIIKILFEMEEDLIIHELIENKILFPKVQKIEAGIIEFTAN